MSINYNMFILLGRVFLGLFLIAILAISIALAINGSITKDKDWFYIIFTFISIPYFLTSLVWSIYRETFHIRINSESLCLVRPILGSKKVFTFEEIRGFSNSEMKFGNTWGMSMFKKNTHVLYTSRQEPIELIQFNYWYFDKIHDSFLKVGIKYLGHEEYKTGLIFRKFTF